MAFENLGAQDALMECHSAGKKEHGKYIKGTSDCCIETGIGHEA